MAKARKQDPRGGHIRLYLSIFNSAAWRVLDYSSCTVWLAMRSHLKKDNNGNISAALGDMKHHGIVSPSTLAKALRSLQAVGLIALTRQGGVAWGQKVCNLFRFTDEDTLPNVKLGLKLAPATNEWMRFRTLAEARSALAGAEQAVVRKGPRKESKNKLGIQKLYRANTDSVAVEPFSNTDSVAVKTGTGTDSVAVNSKAKAREAAPALEIAR